MDHRKGAGKLHEAIEHEQVIAGAALFMAPIGKHLAGEFALEQPHGTAMHGLSLRAIKLKTTEGKGREIFEPVIAAVAVLRMSL